MEAYVPLSRRFFPGAFGTASLPALGSAARQVPVGLEMPEMRASLAKDSTATVRAIKAKGDVEYYPIEQKTAGFRNSKPRNAARPDAVAVGRG